METNPRFLKNLSVFFRYSNEEWLYTITLLELGLKDVQYYDLRNDGPNEAISLVFSGCESVKICVCRRGHKYGISSSPYYHFLHRVYDTDSLPLLLKRVGEFIEWRRACQTK